MKSGKSKRKLRGQTMVEVVVATAMVLMVLVAVVSGVAIGVRNSRYSKNKSIATRLNQEAIEWLRLRRDEMGWQPFVDAINDDGSSVTYCLDVLPANGTAFRDMGGGECGIGEKITISNATFNREMDVSLDMGPPQLIIMDASVTWFEGSKEHRSHAESRLYKWSRQ